MARSNRLKVKVQTTMPGFRSTPAWIRGGKRFIGNGRKVYKDVR